MSRARSQSYLHDERLAILIEECAEVQQASTKILRFGRESINPYSEISNAERLEQELGDLLAMIFLTIAAEGGNSVIDAAVAKLEKLKTYSDQPTELLDKVINDIRGAK